MGYENRQRESAKDATHNDKETIGSKLAEDAIELWKKPATKDTKDGVDGKNYPKDLLEPNDRPIKNIEDLFRKPRVEELSTGDTLVRDGGKQHLFMPNGDHLTVGPGQDYNIKSKDGVDVSNKNGVTTLTYKNGDQVSFDSEGVLSIKRGNEAISFARHTIPGEWPPGCFGPKPELKPIWKELTPLQDPKF